MVSPPTNVSSTTIPHRLTTLDDLPQNLLLRIISFLPTLDAIQTTLISPAFLNLWTSLPSLSFDFRLFLPPADTPSLTLQAFSDFVTRALLLRHPPSCSLRSLHIRLQSTINLRPYGRNIASWIQYAVVHNVEFLSLTFSSNGLRQFQNDTETDDSYYYPFPFSLLRNGSVRSLQLKYCNIDLPMSTSLNTRFESLTCVVFDEVYLTDEMISDLFSWCLNLERLKISLCYGMKDVKICSPRLKSLELRYFMCDEGSVEICAPNMSYLGIFFFEVGRYILEESSAVEGADLMVQNYRSWSKIVRLLSHVKRFHVQNWWYKVVVSKDCLPKSSAFHNLNYLRLATKYTKADLLGIAVLFELSPKLETVILDRDIRISEEIFGGSISEEFERINFKLPSLRQLKLNCYWGKMDELHFLRLVLKSEVVLERIVLRCVTWDNRFIDIPIVLVKQSHGFQIVQGSFPGCGLHEGMDVYQGTEIPSFFWK